MPRKPEIFEGQFGGCDDDQHWCIEELERRPNMPPMTERQYDAVVSLLYDAMQYGYEIGIINAPRSPFRAGHKAIKARRTKATGRHAEIRAAFDAAARAGKEPSIAGIAKRFRVSTATVYRALAAKTK